MNGVRHLILSEAIEHFGTIQQKSKAIEELSELIRAIARNDFQNVAEEMADVHIMLDQLEIMYGNRSAWKSIEYDKLVRLRMQVRGEDAGQ